ncbi:Recessive suppressor of secretory defect [Operophtera brumata]|uniref:Phosphatidylinositol-3-phosphatase SAC1 n=1 Tax=Operophtera brumata TaxID=104452 RepID=A0A0L7KSB0_OPEBR|nr:Recessive suppressor of secretory defect [Operophtera brumata]
MYFSYGYDLTHSLQRLHSVAPEFHKRCSERLIRAALETPGMYFSYGYDLTHSLQRLHCTRAVARAGTRLFMRGVDAQIVERGGEKSSFVQTRGSIPLYWSQYPNIKYKPSMTLSHEDHEALERGFRAAVAAAALPNVRYEPFDFHAECSGMRYHRLQVLIDRITHEQVPTATERLRASEGSGVFRTNCVDCLDRTNVVQSLLARLQLTAVLKLLAVVWADHADMISTQYSGTGALKTDFTRTGKRSHMGLVRDGINSLTRYYMNNFSDGFRQDAIDLFLGKYSVCEGEGNTFPSVLLIAMSMFCASATLPQKYTSEVLMYLMFWGAAVGATLTFIFR